MNKKIETAVSIVLGALLIILIGYSIYFVSKKWVFYSESYIESRSNQNKKENVETNNINEINEEAEVENEDSSPTPSSETPVVITE